MSTNKRTFKVPVRSRFRLWLMSVVDRLFLRRHMDHLCLVAGGHIFFQTLSAAVELGLFTLLARKGPLSRPEICEELGIQEKPARILLLGCTSLRLLRKSGTVYSNTRLAGMALDQEQPRSLVPIIRWQHHINYKPLFKLEESIRENRNVGLDMLEGTEPTLYERLAHDERLETIFQDAMQSISVQANEQLCRFLDFRRFKHVVDVGGGNGTNLMAMARAYPHLKGTVFDSPSVCAIATEHFKAKGLSDRLDAFPGNCFKNAFPQGCDCIVFAHFFTIWSEAKNRQLLEKAYAALPSGGAAIIFNMMQADDESGPLTAAMGSPYFLALATGEGMLYTWSEYQAWMRETGFAGVDTLRLPRDHGVVIGFKP